MSKLSISLIIGIIAGIIDVTPMIIQKLDKYACLSAFVHWVILGIVISYIEMPVAPWLKRYNYCCIKRSTNCNSCIKRRPQKHCSYFGNVHNSWCGGWNFNCKICKLKSITSQSSRPQNARRLILGVEAVEKVKICYNIAIFLLRKIEVTPTKYLL